MTDIRPTNAQIESLLGELVNSVFIAMHMHSTPQKQRELQWEHMTLILDRASIMRDQLVETKCLICRIEIDNGNEVCDNCWEQS